MADPVPASALLAAASASLAVLCAILAYLSRAGQARWEPRDTLGRLHRLARPAWAGAPGRPGEQSSGWPAGGGAGAIGPWAGRLVKCGGTAAAGAVAGWVLFGGAGGLAAAGGAVAALWAVGTRESAARARDRRRLADGLERAVETMIAALKAGQGTVSALEEAQQRADGPFGQALTEVLDAYRAGEPLAAALERLEQGHPSAEVGYLRACLAAHLDTGGDITALLINLGGVIRERQRLARDLVGRTSEARSTAMILALLPPGLLGYILWVDPTQFEPLLGSSFGLAAAVYAGASWLVGVVVVHRMVTSVVREVEEGC